MPLFDKLRSIRQGISRRGPLLSPQSKSTAAASQDDEPIEEEQVPGDRLRHFHPTYPSQRLDGRYETISKLGFGSGSTVWLAENLNYDKATPTLVPRYVTVKIGALDGHVSRELVTSKHIAHANRTHEGLAFIRTPVDDFQVEGPEGTHTCLVYTPMRETLLRFQYRMPQQRLPLPIFKFFTYCLLQSLDYLHTQCHLIHTDLKDDNIMITVESDDTLEGYVAAQKRNPPAKRTLRQDAHDVYVSHDDFGPLRGSRLLPQLGDFDLSFPGLAGNQGHLSPIQSHRYRAPEVFLGTPWSFSTDIWNLGLLMWNLLEDTSLFGRPADGDGEYDAHVHLARVTALLGRPPAALVQREKVYRSHRLRQPIVSPKGRVCHNMNEYWGGPFFDDKGDPTQKDLASGAPKLVDTITALTGKEKDIFLDLAAGMLQWLPENRKTAKQLLEHPFFDSFYKDRASAM